MKLGWLNAMFLLLMLSFQPFAASEPLPILEWCLDDLPEHHHYPDQGQPYGPTVDFMQEVAKVAGFKLRFSPNTPFARCLRLMAQGKTDLMVRLNSNPEREKVMFMLPYALANPEVLVIYKDSPDIQTVAELNRLNLMVIRGYTYNSNTINVVAKHPRSIEVSSLEAGLNMLMVNRGDAIVTTAEYALSITNSMPEFHQQFKLASLVFQEEDARYIHLAFSKASPHVHLKEQIAKAIATILADDGVYQSFHPLSVSPDHP
ncbi:substrate-binding periplasmic protein [Arsukibacterium sp.]|uniref:substrate-binding periplasmic protein n=1 Tax=Arsukibacterium sp. TaxID=1977258 RepID=UPI002FD930E4